MVYGAIYEPSSAAFLRLKNVFCAVDNIQLSYNWLITDCSCYPRDPKVDEMLSTEYCWLSGEELTNLVEEDDFEWMWAVLSAFDKSVSLGEVLKYDLPYADGYRGFWEKPFTFQHPLAKMEIVQWHGCFTLVFSESEAVIGNFRRYYPQSRNLEAHIDS